MGAIDNIGRGEFDELMRRVRALETQSPLEHSSVTNGRLRFIGGELRIDSGGQLVIEGTLSVDGISTVTGSFTVSGPWNLTGNGTITGNVTITGNFTVTGGGKIVAGNVTIEPNKITVGGGASPATLQDGKMSFATGGTVEADTSVGGAKMTSGDAVVNVGSTSSLRKGDVSVIAGPLGLDLNATALRVLLNAPVQVTPSLIPTVTGTGLPANVLMITAGGALRKTG